MSAARCNRIVTFAGVVSPVGSDRTDVLIGWDLIEQLGQQGDITDIAGCDLDSANFQRFFDNPDVYLAPDAPFGTAMFAGVPLTFALDHVACTNNQQVHGTCAVAIEQAHIQRLLAAAQGAEIRHRPIQANQTQQAFDETGRLPQRHTEQDFQGQTGIDRCVAE